MKFGVQGLGFRVWGLGFRVQGSGFRVQGLGFWVKLYLVEAVSLKEPLDQRAQNLQLNGPVFHLHQRHLTARWSTTLSSKVNLPHAIKFTALCGAHLVT